METTVIFVEPVITLAYKDLVIDEGIDVNEVVVIEKTVLELFRQLLNFLPLHEEKLLCAKLL